MGLVIGGDLADEKSFEKRGWFIGHFMEKESVFKNDNFEMKWAVCLRGWQEQFTKSNLRAKTMCVLIEGKFEFEFQKEGEKKILSKTGEFIFWDAGVLYTSKSLDDSVLLVIRWPSVPDDQKRIED